LLAIKKSLASQFNHLLLAISSYGDSGKVVAERLATSIKQHEVRAEFTPTILSRISQFALTLDKQCVG
jgi:hypothetical protein